VTPARNRGILHSGEKVVRFHASDLRITCALEFRGRWNPRWRPHHYTFRFFHDAAVSFAAGPDRWWPHDDHLASRRSSHHAQPDPARRRSSVRLQLR
jgi:hypothetical protein